jgi:hypothetical protein
MGFGAPAPSLHVVVLDRYAGSCMGTDWWRYQSRRRRTDSAVDCHDGCSSSFVPSLPPTPTSCAAYTNISSVCTYLPLIRSAARRRLIAMARKGFAWDQHLVVLDGKAAEWTSRGIALDRSRWYCGGGSSPLHESCGGIRLEASGSEGPEGK